MNCRLSDGAVRVRVTRNELDQLLSSRALTLDVALPRNHAFRVNVRPAAIGGWTLDSDPTGVWITIPRAELESFAQSMPDRDGLEHAFELVSGGSVIVSLEVDIRSLNDG